MAWGQDKVSFQGLYFKLDFFNLYDVVCIYTLLFIYMSLPTRQIMQEIKWVYFI